MTDKKGICAEVAGELKDKIHNIGGLCDGSPAEMADHIKRNACSIINTLTDKPKELKWGKGKRLQWDGTDGRGIKLEKRKTVEIVGFNTTGIFDYQILYSNGKGLWGVFESSLTEIETEKETPDEIWVFDPVNHTWHKEPAPDLALGGDTTWERFEHTHNFISSNDAKPVDEVKFKAGNFVCEKDGNRYGVMEIKEQYNSKKALLTGRVDGKTYLMTYTRLRLATPDDWIMVDDDGTEWRAEYNSNGWIQVFMDDFDLCFHNEHGHLNIKEKINKAMKQLCKALGVPIKSF